MAASQHPHTDTPNIGDDFDLVVGRLESDLPEGAVTSANSSGFPETCQTTVYCCLSAV